MEQTNSNTTTAAMPMPHWNQYKNSSFPHFAIYFCPPDIYGNILVIINMPPYAFAYINRENRKLLLQKKNKSERNFYTYFFLRGRSQSESVEVGIRERTLFTQSEF